MSQPFLATRTVRLAEPSYLDRNIQNVAHVQTIKPYPLNDISDIRTQQAAIAKDLLFALLGYEGCYVRYSERYDPLSVHQRITGPDFKVAKHVDVSLKSITRKLLKYGKYYSGLKGFVEIYDQPQFGRVNQRLCYEIHLFMGQYQKLVLGFEEEFRYNSAFSLNQLDNQISRKCADNLVHLYDIVCSIHSQTEERNPGFRSAQTTQGDGNTNFNTFLQTIRNDLYLTGSIDLSTDTNRFDVCKGGLVLKLVQQRLNQFKGDSLSFTFLTQLFDRISQDYVELLNRWLSTGEINDPFQEFFVKRNDLPTNIFYSNMEKYWDELYVIKIDGIIDQFENKDIQTKVLLTGKYLNIFKQCTGVVSFDNLLLADATPSPIESLYTQDLVLKILGFYKRANNLLLKLLFEGYQFRNLLLSLHKTFLLSDSYQIDKFIEKSFMDLCRNKHSVSTLKPVKTYGELFFLNNKKLSAIDINEAQATTTPISDVLPFWEKFTVDTSSFYELAEEIINVKSFDAEEAMQGNENASTAIKRLVSKSLQRHQLSLAESEKLRNEPESIDDFTIAGVNIDLNLPFPLNLVISENFVFEYQLLFKLQMILKFASTYTDRSWKEITFSTVWKYKNFARPIQKLILRCRVLNLRMKALVNELQNHINFTIVDTHFDTLKQDLGNFETAIKRPSFRNGSAHTDTYMKSTYKSNSVFEDKILASRQISHGAMEQNYEDVYELTNKVGTYLNNILRDSMITNSRLLASLRNILDAVIQYNTTVSRLKKTLILMDAELLRAFSLDFPDRFANIEVSESLANGRIAALNGMINGHVEHFESALREMVYELRSGGSENQLFIVLAERLSEE